MNSKNKNTSLKLEFLGVQSKDWKESNKKAIRVSLTETVGYSNTNSFIHFHFFIAGSLSLICL